MVKFTSFVKYNDKFEKNHNNYVFQRINIENNYEIYKYYGQEWHLQRVLKNKLKYTIWISAFLKVNLFSSVTLPC